MDNTTSKESSRPEVPRCCPPLPAWWTNTTVEAGSEGLYTVFDERAGVAKEVLHTTATRELLHGLGQWMVRLLQGDPAAVAALIRVLIQDNQVGDRASGNPNIRVRPHLPPTAYCGLVCCGVLEPVLGAWVFADAAAVAPARAAVRRRGVAGEDQPATSRVVQSRIKQGIPCGGVWLRRHATSPRRSIPAGAASCARFLSPTGTSLPPAHAGQG